MSTSPSLFRSSATMPVGLQDGMRGVNSRRRTSVPSARPSNRINSNVGYVPRTTTRSARRSWFRSRASSRGREV